MTELGFRLLILGAAVATLGAIMADEIGARGLPEPLKLERLRLKAAVVDASKRKPLVTALRLSLVLGYFAALAAMALFIPGSAPVYLILSVCWTWLSVVDAPHVLSRPYVLFYELSLLLNGATLAVSFASPIADRLMFG